MKKVAEDHYVRYFTEKLWEMIPYTYRHEDGLAEQPGVLRSIVEVLAEQAALLRRSQDRLWEDQFIDWCSDWAVPYIGDLLGTRLVSALNKRGRRVDVAKTIYYRRRKGTPRVLEQLISDIAGWEGKVVENFQRLARSRHGLDPKPAPLAGLFSDTHPGGWADLRNPNSAELVNSAFNEFFHTPDVRQHRGHDGRYNIPKLAIHLYRLKAYPVKNVSPFPIKDLEGDADNQRFTFDPSGRSIPLFVRRDRAPDWEEWRSAAEWELPGPMRCRLLGHAEYLLTEKVIQQLEASPDLNISPDAISALRQLQIRRFRNEVRLYASLQSLNQADLVIPEVKAAILRLAIVQECGKQALLPNALILDKEKEIDLDHGSIAVFPEEVDPVVVAENLSAANLSNWRPAQEASYIDWLFGATAFRALAVDPECGRLMFREPVANPSVNYHYGFSADIGAGTYDRPATGIRAASIRWAGGGDKSSENLENIGVTQIDDSQTYRLAISKQRVSNMVLQAANQERPYLFLASDLILNTSMHISNAVLVLDGLWLGADQEPRTIYLRGDYECVEIRHCTLDPGGSSNCTLKQKDVNGSRTIAPVELVIDGFIEKLCIQNSITGPIRMTKGGTVEQVHIEDSIIQSIASDLPAIQLNKGLLKIRRSTVFGCLQAHRLEASEVLLTSLATVTDTQAGCFRFSAAPEASRVPRAYESYLFERDISHWFTSSIFGHPAFAQLSSAAPSSIKKGGENGAEIGAYNHLINEIKLDGLKAKISEYMPFGLIPLFINET